MPKIKSITKEQLTAFKRVSGDSQLRNKIIEESRLRTHAEFWRKTSWSVVLACGCFDILHVGHLRLLREASYRGDILVVGINSDESVRTLKGVTRPLVPEDERAEMLSHVSCVDYVTIFDAETPVGLIRTVQPGIFCKGGDYSEEELIEAPIVAKYGGRVEILPFHRGHSSTSLIDRLSGLKGL